MKVIDNDLENVIELIVTDEDVLSFARLDLFLVRKMPNLSRSFLKKLFENGDIEISENSPVKPKKFDLSRLPPLGTIIEVLVPPPISDEAKPENIPLEILFEDDDLLIINKPAGLVTHPAPGNYTGTLVNAVLYHCPDLSGIGGVKRPGIVHRLDKGTSGVMVVAKSQKAHEELVLLFSKHDIQRIYEAVIFGKCPKQNGTLESTIGRRSGNPLKMFANVRGKQAITHYQVLREFRKLTHIQLKLETGRTHQIRVHLSQLMGSPILCDPLYGHPKDQLKRLGPSFSTLLGEYPHPLLHARLLGFKHPITKKEMVFETPPPEIFRKTLEMIIQEENV